MGFPTNTVNSICSRRARDRDSVARRFHLIYVVKNGSPGLQNIETVKVFAKDRFPLLFKSGFDVRVAWPT